MNGWYYKVSNDVTLLPDMIAYYDHELDAARFELSLKGKAVEKHAAELPGIIEHRFTQLQEIEAILEFFNIKLKKDRSLEFKKFLESYAKALSSRDALAYVDGVSSIVDLSLIVNEVALIRNKYLSIMKSLETKNYMVSAIVKLKVAGMDDMTVQ
jgi:hypothetical protein